MVLFAHLRVCENVLVGLRQIQDLLTYTTNGFTNFQPQNHVLLNRLVQLLRWRDTTPFPSTVIHRQVLYTCGWYQRLLRALQQSTSSRPV